MPRKRKRLKKLKKPKKLPYNRMRNRHRNPEAVAEAVQQVPVAPNKTNMILEESRRQALVFLPPVYL
jgi:hypothetical protein